MDIISTIRIVISRIPIIVVLSSISAMIVGYSVYKSPKKYRSETRLTTGYTVVDRFSLSEEGLNQFKTDLKFKNLIEIIKSPVIFNTLSYNLLVHDLDSSEIPYSNFLDDKEDGWIEDNYGIKPESIISILKDDKIPKFELLSSYDSTHTKIIDLIWGFNYSPAQLREMTSIRRINGTDYLSIECESYSPYLSAHILNTLTSEFLRYNNKLKFTKSYESIGFLDSLARVKKNDLDIKRNALRSFKSKNNFLNFEVESESKLSQIRETESERDLTLNNIRRIDLSLLSIENKLSSEEKSGELNSLRTQLADLYERRRNGQGNYEQLSDSIVIVRTRLNNLSPSNYTASQELFDQRETLKIELAVEEEKLDDLELKLLMLKGRVSSFARTEATITTMQNEVDLASEEYVKIQERLNDAKNVSAKSDDNISVIVYAQPAIQAQSSGLLIKSGLAFFGVTVLSILVIVLGEILDPRIKSSSRFMKMVNMDLLGTLFTNQGKSSDSIFIPKMLKSNRGLSIEESTRRIRFKINSQNGRVFLFTSLRQNDGKSFVLFEVAKSLTQEGKKILIIDTNFRKSSFIDLVREESAEVDIDKRRRSRNKNSPVLAEKVFPDFQDLLIIPSRYPNVHILPNRNPNGSPSEILERISFQKLINKFINEEGYDFIFLEAQGINECSDALELSIYSDNVIFVFNTNKEITLEDKSSLDITNNLNGKVMGAILNDIDFKSKKRANG